MRAKKTTARPEAANAALAKAIFPTSSCIKSSAAGNSEGVTRSIPGTRGCWPRAKKSSDHRPRWEDSEKITCGKLGAKTPQFVIESDATIVAPLIFAWVLGQ
jgi:hypothetical protein